MNTMRLSLAGFAVAMLGLFAPAYAEDDPKQLASQAERILRVHCFECHGKDSKKPSGRLNLWDRAHLADPKRSIVVAGKPAESELIVRIEDLDDRMPPEKDKAGQPLAAVPAAELAILKKWIEAGAPGWPEVVVAGSDLPPPVGDPPVVAPQPPVANPRPTLQVAVNEPAVDVVARVLERACVQCHGGANPKAGLRVLEYDSLKSVFTARDRNSELLNRIRLPAESPDAMPPPGNGRQVLSAEEIAAFERWIDEGAPAFARQVEVPAAQLGDDYVLQSILSDVLQLRAKNGTDGTRSYRYLSLNHLLARGITKDDLLKYRQALALVLNHLSWLDDFERPVAIEPTETVFRIDLRTLGWDERPFERLETGFSGSANLGASSVNLYDLLLLDYPYGLMYPGSETYRQLLDLYLQPAGLVRPVAFVRADWLIAVAAQPPLYDDILRLPKTYGELQTLLGITAAGDVQARSTVFRAGEIVSGVSKNNRIVERHRSSKGVAYFYESHDYASNRGNQNMFRDPIRLQPDGGEMIWSLPNGLQAYYVADSKGTRLDEAPTSIVTDEFAADKIVRNGFACIRCHSQGVRIDVKDDIRPRVLALPGDPPGFTRQEVRNLYLEQSEIDRYLLRDRDRFRAAVARLFDGQKVPDINTVLRLVSDEYTDHALNVRTIGAELGLGDPNRVMPVFELRDLAAIGMMQLASGGMVRRDSWEDYYDHVARLLGRGTPIVPLDGVRQLDYRNLGETAPELEFKTNGPFFVARDSKSLDIEVVNKDSRPVFVEVVGTSGLGRKFIVIPKRQLSAGQSAKVTVPAQDGASREQVTLYASYKDFEGGEVLRMTDRLGRESRFVADRVMHRSLYQPSAAGTPVFDGASMFKKTLVIESK